MLFSNFAAFNLRHCLELPEIVLQDGKTETELLKSESLVLDSLKFWVEFFNYHSIFNNANTTYKNLENNEKKIISNDSLRLKITLMYERDFANVKKR